MAIIRDSQGPGVIVAWWLGGLFLVSFAAPLSWGLLGRMPIWLAWQVNPMLTFLDLFALTVVGKAVWATLGYLKFGRLSLCVTGNRPAIGGELEATLTLPRVAFAAKYLTVELRCIEIGRPDDGARMDTRQLRNVRVGGVQGILQWSSGPVQLALQRRLVNPTVAIRLPIPAGLPESERPRQGEAASPGRVYYTWELSVGAEVPGPDLARSFEIEVARKLP
jgi:hypothetical protein